MTGVGEHLRAMDLANPDDDLTNAAQFVPKARRFTRHWVKNENEIF